MTRQDGLTLLLAKAKSDYRKAIIAAYKAATDDNALAAEQLLASSREVIASVDVLDRILQSKLAEPVSDDGGINRVYEIEG